MEPDTMDLPAPPTNAVASIASSDSMTDLAAKNEELENQLHTTSEERDSYFDELNRIREGLLLASQGGLGGELQSAFSTFQTFDGAGQGGGDGDNVELLEENAELRASLEEALAELREYKSRLERQQSMLEASQKEEETTFDRLQDDLNSARSKLASLEDESRKTSFENMELHQQNDTLSSEVERCDTELTTLRKHVEGAVAERDDLKEQQALQRARLDDLEESNELLAAEKDNREMELEHVRSQLENGGIGSGELSMDEKGDYDQSREVSSQFLDTPEMRAVDVAPDTRQTLAREMNFVVLYCKKLMRESLAHCDDIDSLNGNLVQSKDDFKKYQVEQKERKQVYQKKLLEKDANLMHKNELMKKLKNDAEAQIRKERQKVKDHEEKCKQQIDAKNLSIQKLVQHAKMEMDQLDEKYKKAKAALNTRKTTICCCANRYNGRYLGQVPIPTNRPDQDILWEAIDRLKDQAQQVATSRGRSTYAFDVSAMTVPGYTVKNSTRKWPKMLYMCTQSGRHVFAQPFNNILSVGQVDKFVIFVCWTRAQQSKEGKKRNFLVHAMEFQETCDAEAMSGVLIKECEEVYKRKGIIEETDSGRSTPVDAAVPRRSTGGSASKSKTPRGSGGSRTPSSETRTADKTPRQKSSLSGGNGTPKTAPSSSSRARTSSSSSSGKGPHTPKDAPKNAGAGMGAWIQDNF